MARAGDSYVVQLKNAHLMWGEYHQAAILTHATQSMARDI